MEPTQFKPFCEILVWKPPIRTNGNIVGYNLRFELASGEEMVYLGPSDFFYSTTETQRVKGVKVQVYITGECDRTDSIFSSLVLCLAG